MELIFGRARRDAAGESQNWLVEQAPHRGHKSGSGLLGRFVSDAAWTQPKNPEPHSSGQSGHRPTVPLHQLVLTVGKVALSTKSASRAIGKVSADGGLKLGRPFFLRHISVHGGVAASIAAWQDCAGVRAGLGGYT